MARKNQLKPDPPSSFSSPVVEKKQRVRWKLLCVISLVAMFVLLVTGSYFSTLAMRDYLGTTMTINDTFGGSGFYKIGIQQQPPTQTRQQQQQQQQLEELAEGAFRFSEARRQSYEEENRPSHWKMKGTGYLYKRQNILLAASLPDETITNTGRTVIRIDDVMPIVARMGMDPSSSTRNDYDTNYCHRLTVWVRVNGPEIFAGTATSVLDQPQDLGTSPSCHWEFPFDLRVPGKYELDAKVLTWNGMAPYEPVPPLIHPDTPKDVPLDEAIKTTVAGRCNKLPGGPETVTTADIVAETGGSTATKNNNTSIVSGGFIGFKFYYPEESCCEVCSRTPHCIYWATPPKNFTSDRFTNGCELYFGGDVDPAYIPSDLASGILAKDEGATGNTSKPSTNPFYHGRPANNVLSDEISYFMGCGWSFWFTLDFPCVSGDLDDRVYSNRTTFSLLGDEPEERHETTTLPTKTTTLPLCVAEHEGSENHGGRWVRLPWPSDRDCPELEFETVKFAMAKFDPERPHCWHRDDLERIGKKCFEMNCSILGKRPNAKWISSVHKETKWFGYWQNDDCDYVEFTNTQLQQCITERKISSIDHEGRSISHFLSLYFDHRLKDIVFYNSTSPDAIMVTLSTLRLMHMGMYGRDLLETTFRNLPNSTGSHEYYWKSAFLTSSEREPMTFSDRNHALSRLAESILHEKGWTMLNGYEMSAAFSYDTATQNDGMHIIGPPMKTIVTKLFHHMCSNSKADGSRVGLLP